MTCSLSTISAPFGLGGDACRVVMVQERGCLLEGCICLIEQCREALKDMWHSGDDVEADLDVSKGGAFGKTEGVAQQDLMGTRLDQERRQSGKIGEDRTDQRVCRICRTDVIRNAETQTFG